MGFGVFLGYSDFDCCFRFDRETVGLVLGKKERERERETWWRLYVLAMLQRRSCFISGLGFLW
jgi:hypothetical protein